MSHAAVYAPDLLRLVAIVWTLLVAVAVYALYENCRSDWLLCLAFALLIVSRLVVLFIFLGGQTVWYGAPLTFATDVVLTAYVLRTIRRRRGRRAGYDTADPTAGGDR